MSDYYAPYWVRINRHGSTHKERDLYARKRDFEKYLREHPSSIEVVVDGQEEQVSLASYRQDPNRLDKILLVRLDSALDTGKIFFWDEEPWLVYLRRRDPNEAYRSLRAVMCNDKLRWVNEFGVLREEHCYLVGSMESTVKNNFRTWNSMITPQPNQFLDAILPANEEIKIGQRFLLSGRAWYVIEYDITSVPNIMYLTLTEHKIDRVDDDAEGGVADVTDLNRFRLSVGTSAIEVEVGGTFEFTPLLKEDGELVVRPLIYTLANESLADIVVGDGVVRLTGAAEGETTLTIAMEEAPEVAFALSVTVRAEAVVEDYYEIRGSDFIRLGQTSEYSIYRVGETETLIPITSFSLSKSNYVTGAIGADGKLKLKANDDMRTGNVVLTVVYGSGEILTKTISIKTLW